MNALSLWRRPARPGARSDLWHRLATAAMARPWHVLVPVVLVLVVLGLPFRHIHLGTPDVSTLPEKAESRRGQGLLAREFPQLEPNSIVVVLRYPDRSGLTPARVDELYALSRWLARLPDVARVDSVVDLDPRITPEQYRQMAAAPREMLPPPLREAFERMVGPRVTMLVAQTPLAVDSQEARALVKTIRREHPPVAAEVLVTGRTAYDVDFVALVSRVAPGAVAFVLAATFVALFLLLGSVLLPLKAVVMNCLSVTASYGALVWIFQDGHFKDWLGFTPGPIEPVIPLIMFCVLFGLSMDYEVLLLSRTHEEFERTRDNGARGDDQGDGHRHGHRDRHGCHGDPRTAGAGDDAAARRLELVGAASAQALVGAAAAAGARAVSSSVICIGSRRSESPRIHGGYFRLFPENAVASPRPMYIVPGIQRRASATPRRARSHRAAVPAVSA